MLTGGNGSTFTGGHGSTFIGYRGVNGIKRITAAYVGEDGIEAGRPYRFVSGVFAAAQPE
jgi:hypothetical protein